MDIWAPHSANASSQLPVLVWLYGGGFVFGWEGLELYNGRRLVETTQVVLVSVGYRVGALGWLALPELRAESTSQNSTGNYGTLDQIEALRFVKAHIDSFGGNPRRVTIFGQSSGGMSVAALLLAPAAKDLFSASWHLTVLQANNNKHLSTHQCHNTEHNPCMELLSTHQCHSMVSSHLLMTQQQHMVPHQQQHHRSMEDIKTQHGVLSHC